MANLYIRYPSPSGGGGGLSSVSFSVGTYDSQTPSANGGSVSSNSIFFQGATALVPGLVSSANQTFAGVKTFNSAPILNSLSVSLPLQLDGAKNIISQAIDLSTAQVIGSISLNNQVSGTLPFASVTGSVSLVNQVVGNLPLSQTSGSISLTAQVSGNLPIAQTSGSVSLTNKVVGNLPLSQTSGSISLTAQVSGVLPTANGGSTGTNTGDVTLAAFGSTPAANAASLSGQVLTLQPADATNPGGISTGAQVIPGAKSFASTIAGPTHIVGSVTFANSSAGGAAYNIVMPGAQGGASTALINNGAGLLSWTSTLVNPMTTSGDIIVGSGTGVAARLAGSTSNSTSFLTQVGSASASNLPIWTALKTPTAVTLNSGSALTYTTAAGARWLRVKMAGGGGGGAGSGVNNQTNGGDGGVTTFGSSLLTANGGLAGRVHNDEGGLGGTATVSSSVVQIVCLPGGQGQGGAGNNGILISISGGAGGNNMFFGGGARAPTGSAGHAGILNTGGGGSGASTGTAVNDDAGSGGGAGGYIEAIIPAPAATYTYTIGTIGSAGAAGTTGFVGGSGAQGVIIVEEHYI